MAKNGSIAANDTLMAFEPRALWSLAPWRQFVNSVFHSMTSSSTSKKQSLRFCCTNSFIGMGCIWPEPEAEVCTFTLSGLEAEKPASCMSFFAAAGSYLMSKKQSLRFCCKNSFNGMGCIWAEAQTEVCHFNLSGLEAQKPASCMSFFAAAGSYLMSNFRLPHQG